MSGNIKWRVYQHIIVPDIPPHPQNNITYDDAKNALKKYKQFLVRWSTNWDQQAKSEWWYVIKDEFDGLKELKSKMRNQVRKGLKNSNSKLICKEDLLKYGYDIYTKALSSYNTYLNTLTRENYIKKIQLLDTNAYDFWGVFCKKTDKLIAYAQNKKYYDCVEYSVIKLDPDYLKLYPSYALIYTMNEYYLSQSKINYVYDGARSIGHSTNIQDFLISKFNFRKCYCKLNIIYSAKMQMFILLLYPIRKMFYKFSCKLFKKIAVLMKQEEIRRSYK